MQKATKYLTEWNDTETEYPENRCLHELIEDQVKKTPDRIAVLYEDQQLSYKDLNERANQFARVIQKLGVGPETLVGICVERSLEMIVCLLAIIKTGGAYVPFDPKIPKERLKMIIDHAGISKIITQNHLKDKLLLQSQDIICLDQLWESFSQEEKHNLGSIAEPCNLAYVIFTSGSTGKPKGVAVQHRSVTNILFWVNAFFHKGAEFQTPTLSNIAFDQSMKHLWAPLLCGGTVLVVPDDINADPYKLCQLISSQQHVVIICVPTLWTAIIDELEIGKVKDS